MEVRCAFDKHHKMIKSLLSHYLKCHIDEYNESRKNGWFCVKNSSNIFASKRKKEKHDAKCKYCQEAKNKPYEDEVSLIGHEIIEQKMPKEKKQIDFPILNFDQFIIEDKDKFIKNEDYKKEIEEEKNILY